MGERKLDESRFLDDVSGRYARHYTEAVHEMVVAKALGNRSAYFDAREKLGKTIAETMGIGEILGATSALQNAARAYREIPEIQSKRLELDGRYLFNFANDRPQSILPRVTFDEAVQDMIDRAPVTIRDAAERTATRISQLYGQGRVVAFARSAEEAVTERAQSLIAQAIKEGLTEATVGHLLKLGAKEVAKRTELWSESYARMAFRTNLNTAVTAGRFRQAQDPDIRRVIPAMRFDAVGDSDTRPNHKAADGIILRSGNSAWNKLATPLGYNCRCRMRHVSLPELRRLGRIDDAGDVIESRIPPNAGPDAGFRHGGRPDLFPA